MSDAVLYLSELAEVRAIDEETREVTYTAATETPVRTWDGPEVLRMKGARLQRFRANPVFLDSHKSHDAGSVIGSVKVRVDNEGRRLEAVVTYARTARAEELFSLVRDKHLRAVSVGFVPNRAKTRTLREGETDGEGDALVRGPARVVNEWELVELSQVAVPADEHALARRTFWKEVGVPDDVIDKEAPPPAEDGGKVIRNEELEEERAARRLKAVADGAEHKKRALLAVCPVRLREHAEAVFAEDPSADVEVMRKALLERHRGLLAPVGTPAAPEPGAATRQALDGEPRTLADVTDEIFTRSLQAI